MTGGSGYAHHRRVQVRLRVRRLAVAEAHTTAGFRFGFYLFAGPALAAPAMSVEQAAPAMSVEQAAPAMSVKQAALAISEEQAAPAMSVKQAAPAMSKEKAALATRGGHQWAGSPCDVSYSSETPSSSNIFSLREGELVAAAQAAWAAAMSAKSMASV